MKKIIKTFTAAATVVALSCTLLLAGCTVSLGADGRDGQDVSIYDIFEQTNAARREEGLEELTFLEFVSEYLSYDSEELAQMTSLQTAINRSLLSSVQVTAAFTETSSNTGNYPFWQPGGGTQTQSYVSQGSGVIIDANKEEGDMYVVTNCHVVYSANADETYSTDVDVYLYGSEYSIYTNNGEDYYIDDTNAIPATIIGASLNYDIAVLKVDDSEAVKRSNVLATDWCEDDHVPVGETVYAIGNAAGDGISATNGIVCVDSEYISLDMYDTSSNYNDDFTYRTVRTSVPIYSGNSGGGLFNADGELVGIINSKTTAASYGEYSDNISHALPAANVRRVVKSMIERYEQTGSATYGVYSVDLGFDVETASSTAYWNNTANLVDIIETVEVSSIDSGSWAENNLQAGDIIKSIEIKASGSDGGTSESIEVTREYNVKEVLLSAREGDCITITVTRAGEENPVSYTTTITSASMRQYI